MHNVLKFFRTASGRLTALVVVAFSSLVSAGVASATETATEEKLKTVATQVGTEGVSLVLVVLAALTALIAAVIIIPKIVGFIRRFI